MSSTSISLKTLLKNWLSALTRDKNVESLQEKLQPYFDKTFDQDNQQISPINPPTWLSSASDIQSYNGPTTSDGLADGEKCRMVWRCGWSFEGTFDRGRRRGRGTLASDRQQIVGFFHNDQLVGSVMRTTKDDDGEVKLQELFYCKQGVLHGFYRSKNPVDGTLNCFGLFVNGKPRGKFWRRVQGGSHMHSTMALAESTNKGVVIFTEEGPDEYFVYPDFSTVLRGEFRSGSMKVAKLHYVTGVSVQMGILNLDTRPPSDQTSRSPVFGRETESIDSICQHPTLADPYESALVYPGISTIQDAGEGLFAKTDIKAGQLIAFFNGVRTRAGGIENADYTIKSDDQRGVFDIPEKCRSLTVYRATLAHKICHSFEPNAYYGHAYHPRFGSIRSAVATKNILRGEEIFCDYKYSLSKAVPAWYNQALYKHLKSMGISQEQVEDVMSSLTANVI